MFCMRSLWAWISVQLNLNIISMGFYLLLLLFSFSTWIPNSPNKKILNLFRTDKINADKQLKVNCKYEFSFKDQICMHYMYTANKYFP